MCTLLEKIVKVNWALLWGLGNLFPKHLGLYYGKIHSYISGDAII